MNPNRRLELTDDEIVVLFDLLQRWEDDGTLDDLPHVDEAERIAMSNFNDSLEPLVDDAFSPDYGNAVERAPPDPFVSTSGVRSLERTTTRNPHRREYR